MPLPGYSYHLIIVPRVRLSQPLTCLPLSESTDRPGVARNLPENKLTRTVSGRPCQDDPWGGLPDESWGFIRSSQATTTKRFDPRNPRHGSHGQWFGWPPSELLSPRLMHDQQSTRTRHTHPLHTYWVCQRPISRGTPSRRSKDAEHVEIGKRPSRGCVRCRKRQNRTHLYPH